MNFINLNCPPLPYFIVGGGCVYRPGDIHERRTIRNVFDLIYVHSGTLYLEQDPFRIELNAGQFFIITPDTPHRGSRVCQEKTTTSWVHFYTNGKYSLSDEFYPDNVTRRAAPKFYIRRRISFSPCRAPAPCRKPTGRSWKSICSG